MRLQGKIYESPIRVVSFNNLSDMDKSSRICEEVIELNFTTNQLNLSEAEGHSFNHSQIPRDNAPR
jgi:hypothetical protein